MLKPMNLIPEIMNLMDNDDCDYRSRAQDLIWLYSKSNESDKQVINLVFITLCGYSLETILKGGSQ